MDAQSKILVDIKFIGQKVIEIEVKDITITDDMLRGKGVAPAAVKYYLKIKENCIFGNSKKIILKRLVIIEDSLLDNIKAVLFKPLKNIKVHNVEFKRALLDNSNYPIYKKALIELGLNLKSVAGINNDGMLNIEVNGFRNLVEYNLYRGRRYGK